MAMHIFDMKWTAIRFVVSIPWARTSSWTFSSRLFGTSVPIYIPTWITSFYTSIIIYIFKKLLARTHHLLAPGYRTVLTVEPWPYRQLVLACVSIKMACHFVCVCRWSCQTLGSAPRWPKSCPRGSLWWARLTGWRQRSSPGCPMDRRSVTSNSITPRQLVMLYKWMHYYYYYYYYSYSECSVQPVCVIMRVRVCVPGWHLVAGHHGDRDGGWGATVLQWAAPTGHEAHQGHASTQIEEYSQGTCRSLI